MFKLTPENRQMVLDTLAQTGGKKTRAVRLLKSRGIVVSYGTVQRVARDGDIELQQASKIEHLGAEVRSLRSKNTRLLRHLGAVEDFHDNLLAAVEPVTPQPKLAVATHRHGKSVELLWMYSDPHVGQKIRAVEVNGFNEYNYAVALSRMQFLTKSIIKYVTVMRTGYKITGMTIICLGDNIHGEIHDEYVRTNEFTVPESIVRSAQLLAGGLSQLAPHFQRLTVHGLLCDNHSRSTKKPSSAAAGRISYNTTLFALLEAYMANHSNIRIKTYEAVRAHIPVNGKIFLCEHGDTVRAALGTPIYGLTRADLAQAKRHLIQRESFDYHLWAHWHTPIIGPFGIVNGAFVGPDEYATNRLPYSTVSGPSQTTFLVHPDHGPFNYIAWDLSQRNMQGDIK